MKALVYELTKLIPKAMDPLYRIQGRHGATFRTYLAKASILLLHDLSVSRAQQWSRSISLMELHDRVCRSRRTGWTEWWKFRKLRTTNLFEWAKEKWDADRLGSLAVSRSPTNETHSSLPCREIVILLMKMAAFSAFSTA